MLIGAVLACTTLAASAVQASRMSYRFTSVGAGVDDTPRSPDTSGTLGLDCIASNFSIGVMTTTTSSGSLSNSLLPIVSFVITNHDVGNATMRAAVFSNSRYFSSAPTLTFNGYRQEIDSALDAGLLASAPAAFDRDSMVFSRDFIGTDGGSAGGNEDLGVDFILGGGGSVDRLMAAIDHGATDPTNLGTLFSGLHAINDSSSLSDALIVTTIPLPAAFGMGVVGLLLAGIASRWLLR